MALTKNDLERRLRELDQESKRLRRAMRSVERNPGRLEVPAMPAESDHEKGAAPPAATANAGAQPAANEGDLFAWQEQRKTAQPVPPTRGGAREIDQRLANYLSSGSFYPMGRPPVDRRVRRNKIMFITAVAMLTVYVLWWLLWRN